MTEKLTLQEILVKFSEGSPEEIALRLKKNPKEAAEFKEGFEGLKKLLQAAPEEYIIQEVLALACLYDSPVKGSRLQRLCSDWVRIIDKFPGDIFEGLIQDYTSSEEERMPKPGVIRARGQSFLQARVDAHSRFQEIDALFQKESSRHEASAIKEEAHNAP